MIFINKSFFFRSGLLIALACFFIALLSSSVFLHIHVKTDGEIVVHSHLLPPISSDNDSENKPSKHNHSESEYLYYTDKTHLDKFIVVVVDHGYFLFEKKTFKNSIDQTTNTNVIKHSFLQRAPPLA